MSSYFYENVTETMRYAEKMRESWKQPHLHLIYVRTCPLRYLCALRHIYLLQSNKGEVSQKSSPRAITILLLEGVKWWTLEG